MKILRCHCFPMILSASMCYCTMICSFVTSFDNFAIALHLGLISMYFRSRSIIRMDMYCSRVSHGTDTTLTHLVVFDVIVIHLTTARNWDRDELKKICCVSGSNCQTSEKLQQDHAYDGSCGAHLPLHQWIPRSWNLLLLFQ